jgi:hypothetical protein
MITSCSVVEDTFGERLNLAFRYEVKGETFRGSILIDKRRVGTAAQLEDDILEGHKLSIRVNPSDGYVWGGC